MGMGVRNANATVNQLRSHDVTGEVIVNCNAGYGWVAVHGSTYTADILALLQFQGTPHYAFVAYDKSDGLPEEYDNWTIVWQAPTEEDKRDG